MPPWALPAGRSRWRSSTAACCSAARVFVWLMNLLANVSRGAGNMMVPAFAIAIGEAFHLALSPALILGWGPFPALGIIGAALAALSAYAVGATVLVLHLVSRQALVRLRLRRDPLQARRSGRHPERRRLVGGERHPVPDHHVLRRRAALGAGQRRRGGLRRGQSPGDAAISHHLRLRLGGHHHGGDGGRRGRRRAGAPRGLDRRCGGRGDRPRSSPPSPCSGGRWMGLFTADAGDPRHGRALSALPGRGVSASPARASPATSPASASAS